jgi:transposase
MNNALIHSSNTVDSITLERGYIPLYVPFYSPEPNSIEMFWKVSKDQVGRGESTGTETLFPRVIESSEDVLVKHIQNFVQHLIDVFPKCLNKEPL